MFLTNHLSAQTPLNRIGQTPGGSSFHTHYNELTDELYVGCGSSVWIFDISNPDTLNLIAKRPLMGLVNETWDYGDTLFAAASHDGLWALDRSDQTLPIIDHYSTPGDTAAYDLWQTNDSIFIANGEDAVLISYNNGTFTEQTRFGEDNVVCLGGKNQLLAIGERDAFTGKIHIYNLSDLTTPLATWSSNQILYVEDVQFADLNDSIIYVAGGTNLTLTSSRFFALEFDGSSLTPLDTMEISGLLGTAIPNFNNMDSRNDTIFVSSTAGLLGTETNIPVVDATGLPAGTMDTVGNIFPGLWHFDVAILGTQDLLALSSEWYGVQVSDFSAMNRYDTVSHTLTGGWGIRSYVFGDTLWTCLQGYGLSAYLLDDLYYTSPYVANQELLNINKPFVNDFVFVNDTLMFISGRSWKYYVYNLAPWFGGGEPELIQNIYDAGTNYIYSLGLLETNLGPRIIGGRANVLSGANGYLELIDPFDDPAYSIITTESTNGKPNELITSGNNVWLGGEVGAIPAIMNYSVTSDVFTLEASALAPGPIEFIAKENGTLAAACGVDGIAIYQQVGSTITQVGLIGAGQQFVDVEIRNSYLYACEKFGGVYIWDISNPSSPTLEASGNGTNSWFNFNSYGSMGIDVGPDGEIYLSDFHAGTIIYEAFDSAMLSIADHQEIFNVAIYPNPTRHSATIELTDFKDAVNLQLTDGSGKLLKDIQIESSIYTLSMEDCNPGIYFLRFETEKGSFIRKLMLF